MDVAPWRQRLIAAIEADGRSDRAISLAAGLGSNYIQQMRQRGTSPALDHAEKLCAALGISAVYVMTGIALDNDGEKFIRLAATLSSEQRRQLLGFLETLSPSASGQ